MFCMFNLGYENSILLMLFKNEKFKNIFQFRHAIQIVEMQKFFKTECWTKIRLLEKCVP